ncbi:hypothetical protein [Pseudomonas cavernae]|nr:hypothetical protein [Pseudomonas cavernae]
MAPGVVGQLGERVSLYPGVEHSRNLDSHEREDWGGNLGIRLAW